jgi:hypothetical protein
MDLLQLSRASGLVLLLIAMMGCEPEKPDPNAPKKAAAAPKADADQLKADRDRLEKLFPRIAGGEWEYEEKIGDAVHQLKTTCLGEKEVGEVRYTFFTTRRDGEPVLTEGYTITPDAVLRISSGENSSNSIEPPMPVLKVPIKQGQNWKWQGRLLEMGISTPAEASLSVTGPVKLKVPYGELETWQISQTYTISPGNDASTITSTQWFAEGIGLVKQETRDGEAVTTAQLVHFTASSTPKPMGEKP